MSTGAKKKLSIAVLLATAFLAGVFFVTSAANLLGPGALSGRDAQAADLASAADLSEAFEAVAEAVNPAVVQIRSTRLITQGQGGEDPFRGTPFEDFFQFPRPGGPDGQPFEQDGLGSGAFIRADGYVVTNNHVVEQADELEVVLFDGRTLRAEVVGADAFSDIAVLKVEGDGFPYLGFGEDDALRVGQWVLAFGSPLDAELSNTVTAGIVSALGRRQGPGIANYIQTDAAINPGNSGGPLVNLEGEIVGINSAIATRTGGFQGIGFAVPVDVVRNTVDQLLEDGTVERGYLGIGIGPVTPSLARALGIPLGAAQVGTINEDADGRRPAAEAGLETGDVIVSVDGHQLSDYRELISLVSNKRPGDEVTVVYNRDGDAHTATITLGRRPGDPTADAAAPGRPQGGSEAPEPTSVEDLGLTLQNVTPTAAERYRLGEEPPPGALITDVERDSEAYRDAELRPGDVITEVDREPVSSVAAFEQAYRGVRAGETFLLRVQRGENSFLTALTKPS
jgi:serine protease Do